MKTMPTLVLTCILSALCTTAIAADIKVLSAGAFKPVLVAMAPAFEQRTGHKLVIDNDTAGALVRRINAGEAFDLVVAPPPALAQMAQAGKLASTGPRALARVAIGVAVKDGAAKPDISTVASFQQALHKARAVAYIDPAAGGSSGIYLSQLFERWGLAPMVRAKAVLVPGGLVASRLVTGEADLAIHQISEILAVPGVTLVGPLPAEVQNYTVYSAVAAAAPGDAGAVRALIEWLASDAAGPVLAAKGMLAP
jgi:molybdate transport system substrate-binding protein